MDGSEGREQREEEGGAKDGGPNVVLKLQIIAKRHMQEEKDPDVH